MNKPLQSHKKEETALVIGAGIAGLLTARVLSSYFKEVLVVEKDELSQKAIIRRGTPQAFHPHRVILRGDVIMNRFFPGYVDDLLMQGAHNSKNDKAIQFSPYGNLELVIDQKSAASSRALLEWTIRQRVQKISNVRFLTGKTVTGLLTLEDHKQVVGVRMQERNKGKKERTVDTDLVIDTSGRFSTLNKWLQSMGHNVPEPERLQVHMGYSTRYYRVPPHINQKVTGISRGNPEKNIGIAGLLYIEENIAQALLYNAGGAHYPPTDTEEYEKELDTLAIPMVQELLQELEPLSEPRGFRAHESTRQHYEQMEDWPSGLLVLGDAFCNFDPIFGQGMTVAAIEAEMLDLCLSEREALQPEFERNVLQRMQEAIEPAWWLSSIEDLRWKGVKHVGSVPLKGVTFAQKYFDLYLKHATKQAKQGDFSMFQKYMMVNGLVHSPREIINPRMFNQLITGDGSPEEKQLLAELGEVDVTDETQVQERINELIPFFTLAFNEKVPDMFSSKSDSTIK